MTNQRATQEIVLQELSRYPHLSKTLGDDWIACEYDKPFEKWSLITGWLSKSARDPKDSSCARLLSDLDNALDLLESCVSLDAFHIMQNKVRSHSDRQNFKGTLSEIAVWVFLAKRDIPFSLETQLGLQGTKDVDISAYPDSANPIHIEVQWLSESAKARRGTTFASHYGQQYCPQFDYERYRVKLKIYEKTSKLTQEDITLVALDCASDPMSGGATGPCTIAEASAEIFTGRDLLSSEQTSYANSEIDRTIRLKVDGVIWFESQSGHNFFPQERGGYLNPNSLNRSNPALLEFMKVWTR